jgi:hypothetical protein
MAIDAETADLITAASDRIAKLTAIADARVGGAYASAAADASANLSAIDDTTDDGTIAVRLKAAAATIDDLADLAGARISDRQRERYINDAHQCRTWTP